MDIFQNYCVVYERQQTVPQLRIVPFDKPEDQYVVQVHCKLFMCEAGPFKLTVKIITVGLESDRGKWVSYLKIE